MSDVVKGYWQQRLAIPAEALNLPIDRSRVDSVRQVDQVPLRPLSEAQVQALENLAESEGLPLPIIHLSVFYVTLFHYTRQTELCVGTPPELLADNANQLTSIPQLMPVVVHLDPKNTFSPFAHSVHEQFKADAQGSDAASLSEIASCAQGHSDNHVELFRAVFSSVTGKSNASGILQSFDEADNAELAGVECHLAIDGDSSIATGQLHYRSDLFDTATMERLSNHYMNVLDSVTTHPDVCLGDMELLSSTERSHLIEGLNQTHMPYPADKTISQLFSEQAESSGDAVAVRGPDDRTLSYAQLDKASNRLAAYLASRGIGSGSRVGVYLERSVEMVSTLLAVLKSGAAYVPLDPLFPADRLSFMARDAELSLVVTHSSLAEQVPIQGSEMIVLDSLEDQMSSADASTVECSSASSLAYVIYTSGSTGRPKGVEVCHRALVNFLCSMRKQPGLSATDKLLAVTTLSFDIAGLEIYLPLLVGAEVILASREEAMDPQKLSQRLHSCDASVMQATPATWKMLIESGWSGSGKLQVWCGGEAMSRDLADELLDRSEQVWNLYGPTETTIWSTLWRVEHGCGVVPVGKPIGNTQVYVLDESGKLVAPGVSGELHIGGDGVAAGYLNQPDLSAEKFITDQFSGVAGARLYKTGDRARWRSDGQLEVQGRLDDQVKLRGYRIEPGEIRSALVEQDTVRDAVLMVRDDGPQGAQLVAYVLGESGHELDVATLRAGLKSRMPEYMVPSLWVELEELPLTPNGKVDKKRLPPPQASMDAVDETPDSVEPLSETESQVASIWQDVLGVESVGIDRSFFELGGNSLSAIRLVAKLREKHGIVVPVISLFQGSTVADIARKHAQKNIDKTVPEIGSVPADVAVNDQTVAANSPQSEGSEICRLISRSTGDQPFFILGSNPRYALATTNLASHVSVYQMDAYALQVAARNAGEPVPDTIEKIAAAFLQEMKKVQPHGPYRLGGGCEGALVALELALLLQRSGDKVEQIMTWHTPAPGPMMKKEFGGSTLKRFWWQLQSIISQGSASRIGLHGYLELIRHELVEYSLFSAMFKYRPENVLSADMELILLEPIDGQVSGVDDDHYKEHVEAWKATVDGHVTVSLLKGNHDTWLKNHVDVFGDFLAAKLGADQIRKIA